MICSEQFTKKYISISIFLPVFVDIVLLCWLAMNNNLKVIGYSMAELCSLQHLINLREVVELAELVGHHRHHERRTVSHRIDPLQHYSDEEFLSRYRLKRKF